MNAFCMKENEHTTRVATKQLGLPNIYVCTPCGSHPRALGSRSYTFSLHFGRTTQIWVPNHIRFYNIWVATSGLGFPAIYVFIAFGSHPRKLGSQSYMFSQHLGRTQGIWVPNHIRFLSIWVGNQGVWVRDPNVFVDKVYAKPAFGFQCTVWRLKF